MKGKRFLAFVMVCVLVSFAGSAEALSFPKISKSTRKGIGKLLNKVVDNGSEILKQREKTKQEEARARNRSNAPVIKNNNNININNNTTINQTQINQTQNIGTVGGNGSARMRIGRPRSELPSQLNPNIAARPNFTANPASELKVSMKNAGARIITNNAPSYEIQLARSELPERATTVFNKVCAANKTIVAGDAGSNKRYGAFCMMTSDPSIVFAGGIHVGAPVSTVEKFFGETITQLSPEPGHAHIEADNSVEIDILYSGNRITQIGYYDSNSLSCKRTGSFVSMKSNEMGLYQMY